MMNKIVKKDFPAAHARKRGRQICLVLFLGLEHCHDAEGQDHGRCGCGDEDGQVQLQAVHVDLDNLGEVEIKVTDEAGNAVIHIVDGSSRVGDPLCGDVVGVGNGRECRRDDGKGGQGQAQQPSASILDDAAKSTACLNKVFGNLLHT